MQRMFLLDYDTAMLLELKREKFVAEIAPPLSNTTVFFCDVCLFFILVMVGCCKAEMEK